ncbi:hypothetical protein Ancab_011167, partial [Ancistrocladus abbreviatus]
AMDSLDSPSMPNNNTIGTEKVAKTPTKTLVEAGEGREPNPINSVNTHIPKCIYEDSRHSGLRMMTFPLAGKKGDHEASRERKHTELLKPPTISGKLMIESTKGSVGSAPTQGNGYNQVVPEDSLLVIDPAHSSYFKEVGLEPPLGGPNSHGRTNVGLESFPIHDQEAQKKQMIKLKKCKWGQSAKVQKENRS